MSKLEFPPKEENNIEEDETKVADEVKKTILERFRNSPKLVKRLFKVFGLAVALSGGLESCQSGDGKECKVEASANQEEVKTVDISQFLRKDFVEEVAVDMKSDGLFKRKFLLMQTAEPEVVGDRIIKPEGSDSVYFAQNIQKVDSLIEKAKKDLSKEEKKEARNKIIDLVSLVEETKDELIKHIQSDEYFTKLKKEFKTDKATKVEQNNRINNVNSLVYEFKNSNEISNPYAKNIAYAYNIGGTNRIVLPYDIDLNNESKKNFFLEAISHEIGHVSTFFESGMSEKAKDLLKKYYITKPDEKVNTNEYFSQPGELIVRKQNLDRDMERLGIKKYGEEFTEQHYIKLLKIRLDQIEGLIKDENKKLSQDALDFIDHIEPDDFAKVMNELANVDNKGKNAYPDQWFG